jgi:signal transduction histidine kinase
VLYDFLTANRDELIERCRDKVARRRAPDRGAAELEYGVPRFIDQLIHSLRLEQSPESLLIRSASSGTVERKATLSEISGCAAQHGRELLEHGFTVDEVVHDYGDLCQAVTELAIGDGAAIQIDEFRTLNRCLDNAIADAVMEYSRGQNMLVAERGLQALSERLGFLAHELRNRIQTASLALIAIQSGKVAPIGATGAVLERSLTELRSLIDRFLADVRVTAAIGVRQQLISVADFIGQVKAAALLEAQAQGCKLTVSAVDAELAVNVDRDLLLSAVGNLLQNAFKFTAPRTEVSMNTYARGDRIVIEVTDHCGGLPPGNAEHLFKPFIQGNADKSGMGLGLSICRRSVEANQGVLSVCDLPGKGCVFTIDLPRCVLSAERADAAKVNP